MAGHKATFESSKVVIYTDGSCLGNPGPGGWAWAVPRGEYESGAEAQTTNQRMEITAVLEALRAFLDRGDVCEILIKSDSTYVVKCFVDKWWVGWEKRGWKNAKGQSVANQDLWRPLLDLVNHSAKPIIFEWVKGHSGDRWNDVVDELAVEAASRGSGSTGSNR